MRRKKVLMGCFQCSKVEEEWKESGKDKGVEKGSL